jgi:hypothetical protein
VVRRSALACYCCYCLLSMLIFTDFDLFPLGCLTYQNPQRTRIEQPNFLEKTYLSMNQQAIFHQSYPLSSINFIVININPSLSSSLLLCASSTHPRRRHHQSFVLYLNFLLLSCCSHFQSLSLLCLLWLWSSLYPPGCT